MPTELLTVLIDVVLASASILVTVMLAVAGIIVAVLLRKG
jgi:hypothetical protein